MVWSGRPGRHGSVATKRDGCWHGKLSLQMCPHTLLGTMAGHQYSREVNRMMLTLTASTESAAFSCTRHGDPRVCNGHATCWWTAWTLATPCPPRGHVMITAWTFATPVPPDATTSQKPGQCSHQHQHTLRLPKHSTTAWAAQHADGTSSACVPSRRHTHQQQSTRQDSSLQQFSAPRPPTWDVHTGWGALTRLLLTVNELMFT